MRKILIALLFFVISIGCNQIEEEIADLSILRAEIGDKELSLEGLNTEDIPIDQPIIIIFSEAIDPASASDAINLFENIIEINFTTNLTDDNRTLSVYPIENLIPDASYRLVLTTALRSALGNNFIGQEIVFRTRIEN